MWDSETFSWSNFMPRSALEKTVGLVLECPEPSVTIKGCADPAAVLLSGDGPTVSKRTVPPPPCIYCRPAPRFTVYGHLGSAS